MKKSLLAASILCSIATFQSVQAGTLPDIPGEFESYVTLVSEYSFRGVAQSDEGPALQGGVDWSHDSGFYVGAWASTVDFNDGDEANIELDLFAGYSFNPIENVTLDVGGLYYAYPGARSNLNYDFYEVYGSAAYDFGVASVKASAAYTPENFGKSGDAQYYSLNGEVPLPHDFTLSAHVGRQYIDDEATFGLPDYTDWGISLQWQYGDVALNVSYIDTSLSSNRCADGCSERIITGASFSF